MLSRASARPLCDILDKRFARGELTKEQHEELKRP